MHKRTTSSTIKLRATRLSIISDISVPELHTHGRTIDVREQAASPGIEAETPPKTAPSALRATRNANPQVAKDVAYAGMIEGKALDVVSEEPSRPRFEAIFLHLTVKRRTSNAEPLGNFRHMPTIPPQRQADHIRLDGIQAANIATI